MVISYKTATAEDVDAILSLSRQLVEKYEDLSTVNFQPICAWLRNKIVTHIDQYTCICIAGQTVGYYRLHPEGDATELDDFYILSDYRGKGIGTAVLQACCERTEGDIFLYVFTGNTGAIRLYQRHGFTITQYVGNSRCIMTRKG